MQNVQNAAEIQQRVINLVELYRTKAGKESQMAKDLAEEYKHQYDNEMDIAMYLHEQGTNHYALNIDFTEEEIDSLRVNQQLLGHFYKEHAGNDANPQVLAELLNEKYDSNVFTAEEESFLLKHFKEMVNYIIQTPNNDLSAIEVYERMDFYLIPSEVLDLIKNRVKIPTGSKIYNPFTGFAQLACMYPECSFVCEESYIPYNKRWNKYCDWSRKEANVIHHKIDEHKLYAWMKVALYANEVDVKESVEDFTDGKYDIAMTFIPWIPNAIPDNAYGYTGEARNDNEIADKICNAYRNLQDGGIMVLLLPNEHLYGNIALNSLWSVIHNENSLKEIIQLPPVMGGHLHKDCSIVIAEKGRKDNNVIFTDARYAFDKTENKNFKGRLDLSTFSEMMQNGGIEGKTGLRKSIQIPSSSVNPVLLIPQVYVVETPSENEKPVPLSSLCQLVTERVKDVKFDLPLDTPLVTAKNLTTIFNGTLNIDKVEKANCPNNPPHTEEYTFDKNGNFIDEPIHYILGEGAANSKSLQVAEYRQSVFLDGSKHAVLFALTKEGLKTALYEPFGKPVAIETNPSLINQHFYVVLPKDGIDALSLLAILRLPVVYRQLQAFEEFGLYGQSGHLKDIFVPTDKRIVFDEMNRLLQEQRSYNEQKEKLDSQRTEYINEVRMRKHDMGQYIFELVNIEDLMRYYVENRDKEEHFFLELETLLDNFRSSLGELSTLLDNLSKEEEFGVPERFNLDEYLSQLRYRHKADGFKIIYVRDESSIRRYNRKIYMDEYIEDALIDAQIQAHEDEMAMQDDIADALIDAQIQAHEDEMAIQDDIADALIEAQIQAHEDEMAIQDDIADALIEAQIQDHEDEILLLEETLDDDEPTNIDDILDNEDFTSEDMLSVDEEPAYTSGHLNSQSSTKVPSIYISPNDIQRAINNIIDNARKHGFTDRNRNDYEVKICMSIDTEKNEILIDFSNNGNPLPEGMDKIRYGIKGEKAGKNAGTGIGGSYIKKFVEHYGGDYDVFMNNGWTVIRIYLPIG